MTKWDDLSNISDMSSTLLLIKKIYSYVKLHSRLVAPIQQGEIKKFLCNQFYDVGFVVLSGFFYNIWLETSQTFILW